MIFPSNSNHMNFGSTDENNRWKNYIIALLVKQADAEGNITPAEEAFLDHAAKSLGLSEEEVRHIKANPDAYKVAPPPNERTRMTILYYLLFMMRADGEIRPEEEKLCYEIGFRLGFRMEMISNLIGVMRQYLRQQLPPDAMLEKIKPYLS